MSVYSKQHYADSEFFCPRCEQNDLLYELREWKRSTILFWTVSQSLLYEKFHCERCNCDLKKSDLKIVKEDHYFRNGIKNTVRKESRKSKDGHITKVSFKEDYSEYIPKDKDKTLYFDMLFMLIDYIETYQPNIEVENNKTYQLALQYKSVNDEEYSVRFEDNIKLKFKACIEELSNVELHYLLKNSLNVLKDEIVVDHKIEKLYFDLFNLMQINELRHVSHFYGLKNQRL